MRSLATVGMIALQAVAAAQQVTSPPAVGFVLSLRGPWQLDGRIIRRGEGVPANARLLLSSDARFDTGQDYSLDIVLLNNKLVFCHSAAECRTGLTVPPALNADQTFAKRVSSVFARIFEKPERWVGLVSRGGATQLDLRDTVVASDAQSIDVGDWFSRVPAGEYRLTFRTGVETGTAPMTYSADINLTKTPPATVRVAVPPGVYLVRLSPRQENAALGREAWALVADRAHFAEASASFSTMMRDTSTWAAEVPATDLARFRHAYLAELAAGSR